MSVPKSGRSITLQPDIGYRHCHQDRHKGRNNDVNIVIKISANALQ